MFRKSWAEPGDLKRRCFRSTPKESSPAISNPFSITANHHGPPRRV